MANSNDLLPRPLLLVCISVLLTGCIATNDEMDDEVVIVVEEFVDIETLPAENGDTDSEEVVPEPEPESEPVVVNDSPAGITDLIMITGQSNALGAETDFDPTLDSPMERVYVFTEDDGWQLADLHQVWDLSWHPRTHPDGDPHNNFGFHFAKTVAGEDSDRVIGFVLASAPGEGISHWDYNTYFYNKVKGKAISALNELPHRTDFDAILWHQGETDWLLNGSSDPDLNGVTVNDSYYSDKLNNLIANFRTENWFGSDGLFICGETAGAPVNARLMALNDDGDDRTGCVSGLGLSTFDQPDYVHFTAEALRELGGNYADTYLQMTP